MEKEEFIKEFSRKIVNNETSLFLGAGFSINSNMPSWRQLMEPCADALHITLNDESDFAQIAQYYETRRGRSQLVAEITSKINKNATSRKELTELLTLDFHSIWTTNFDNIIENSLNSQNISCNVISTDESLSNYSSSEKINLYKCGGDIANARSLFLTKTDYEDYANSRKTIMSFLLRELILYNFLFVGYSFKDLLVKQQLRNVKSILKESAKKHYAIIFKNDLQDFNYYIEDLERNYNLNVITVKNEKEFFDIINGLIREVRDHYVFISESLHSSKSNETNYLSLFCKELSEKLLDNGYCIVSSAGKNIGNYICGAALRYLRANHIKNTNKKLMIEPLPQTNNLDELHLYRKNLIKKCGSVIFISGSKIPPQTETRSSLGTYHEYKLAEELNLRLIPVPFSSYTALKIYKELIKNGNLQLKKFDFTVEKKFDLSSIDKTVNTILSILLEK